MEYYSAMKKNEIMPFAATWMDLEMFILSEVRQKEKEITYIYNLKYDTHHKTTRCQHYPLSSWGSNIIHHISTRRTPLK